MKKKAAIVLAMLMLFAITGCETQNIAQEETEPIETQETVNHDFGAKSALEQDELTIEQMLGYAIQDEYLARQEYELIVGEYGQLKPFTNIIRAEETHIQMLKDIYKKYGYEMPIDNAIDYAVLPNSLEEAFDIGVQAEIDNIAMYEKFLENELPDDIEVVFIELRDGSKNHLAAFERGVRGNGRGKG